MTRTATRVGLDAPARASRGDRDLSWLDFEDRVLALAADHRRPLAERVKLCAIVSSNLDEFFAVRVARLHGRDDTSATAARRRIRRRVLELQAAQDELWLYDLRPDLARAGLRVDGTVAADARTPPLRIDQVGDGGFPHVHGGTVVVALTGRGEDGRRRVGLARARRRERFVFSDGNAVPVEELVVRHSPALPDGTPVDAHAVFRLTRSAELSPPRSDGDPLEVLEHQLFRRSFAEIVRIEVAAGTPAWLTDLLLAAFDLDDDKLFQPRAPLGLGDLRTLLGAIPSGRRDRVWQPTTPVAFAEHGTDELFARLRHRPRLVHHPYESFETSVQTFADAARDPQVTRLAATVYRTSRPSGTLASLVASAAEGKHALCVVELRARFDEEHNLEWSRALGCADVDVVHGAPEHKVHTKLMAITREEADGPRRYVHIGTGNYHSANAFGYEDVSLFSADEALGADVEQVFEALAHGTRPAPFRKLLVAPWYLREGLLREIATVTRAARRGRPGRIRIKVNALGDGEIADALCEASCAGARVQLIVRGPCTLLPGMPGASERITVRSVLGRFLEHSRLFSFEADGERRMWLGSADLLTRNLDRRVETLAPIEHPHLQARLAHILDVLLADNRDAWELDARGWWSRVEPLPGEVEVSAQETFMARAARRSHLAEAVPIVRSG